MKPPSLISTGIASFLRAEDIAWLLLFTGLAVFGPDLNYDAYIILLLFAAFLVAEPKIKAFSTRRGQIVALLVKVLLSYLLIGFSHGIDSNYYLILLLPVISAATSLDLAGTTVFILLCAAAYLSFLGFINWETHYIPPDQQRLLCLHVAFIAVAGYSRLSAGPRETGRNAPYAGSNRQAYGSEPESAPGRGLAAAE